MKESFKIGSSIIIITLLLFGVMYFLFSITQLGKAGKIMKEIPRYSESGNCESTDFKIIDIVDEVPEYHPSERCTYQSSIDIIDAINRYNIEMTSNGWNCLYDDFSVKAYGRTYYNDKNGFISRITFYVDGKISITVLKKSSEIESSGCKEVELIGVMVTLEDGLTYHPGLDFRYKK
jgi:hypothetical protein